jgi:hypothetical protein
MDPFVNEFRRGVARGAFGHREQFGAATWLASERTLCPVRLLVFADNLGAREVWLTLQAWPSRSRAVLVMASDGSLDPGRLLSGYRNVSGPGGLLAVVTRMGPSCLWPRVFWRSDHLWCVVALDP